METASVIAIVLGAVGAVVGSIAAWQGQRGQLKGAELALAWDMTQASLADIRAERDDLRVRVRDLEKASRQQQVELERATRKHEAQLRQCEEGRHQLELRLEILRLRSDERPESE